jgi:phospholipid N-methyltransferase
MSLRERLEQAKARYGQPCTVVHSPLLYPTPPVLVTQMIDHASLAPSQRILEPSAGTGNIIKGILGVQPSTQIHAVEVDWNLVQVLKKLPISCKHADFLEVEPSDLGLFDRILMNPPFHQWNDIAHITHAIKFLKPNGVLVGLCANGPKQRVKLQGLAESTGGSYENLGGGLFTGTNVNTAMVVIYG